MDHNSGGAHRSRVWAYFSNRDGDPDTVRCNLCSAKLNNRGHTGVLWEHVRAKHLGAPKVRPPTAAASEPNGGTSYAGTRAGLHNQRQANMTNVTSATKTPLNANKPPTSNRLAPPAPTTGVPRLASSTGSPLRQPQSGAGAEDARLHDQDLASMKPNPSLSSIDPRNLISRLNQLSLPVARKLKFWNKKSFQVNQYDPSFKVVYLGNLAIQLWSKEESCLDKPLNTLWNNYLVNMKTEIVMRLTICNSGLKAITRQHGLTQYWSNRLVFCCTHKNHPRIFSWVYRHEGKKMRQELRCHAVFCPSPEKASKMVTMLNQRLACALQEFKREKKARGVSVVVGNDSTAMHMELPRIIPLRRQILAKGAANFRPPLERSKSAPKLFSIVEEEDYASSDEEEQQSSQLDEDQFQSHYIAQADLESSFGEEESGDEDDDAAEEKNKLAQVDCPDKTIGDCRTIGSDTSDKLKLDQAVTRRLDSEVIKDDSVYSAEDGTASRDDEEEDSMQKLESNSLTTTVNEETSNCSVSSQGDTKLLFDQQLVEQSTPTTTSSVSRNQHHHQPQQQQIASGSAENGALYHQLRSPYNVKLNLYPTGGSREEDAGGGGGGERENKVLSAPTPSDQRTATSTATTSIFIRPASTRFLDQNRTPLQSSANNNTNSSASNYEHKMETTLLIRNSLPDETKDANRPGRSIRGLSAAVVAANGLASDPLTEEAAARDIVLSWSNLVIE